MYERILVNLFAMPAAQVFIDLKARLPDYVAKREDITVVRSGSHFVSFLFVFFGAPCG